MPKELHFSLFPGLEFVRDEQGRWHSETTEDGGVDDPTIKAVASRLPSAPHARGLSDLFTVAAKAVAPIFQPRPNVVPSLFSLLETEPAKIESPVEGPDHEAHLLGLFRQSDELHLLGLQGASSDRLREIQTYVGNLDAFERPKFQAYATLAAAQGHLAGGDLDGARSALVGGPMDDPRVAALLDAVNRAYAVRQSERIIQVVSAAAMVAQKRIGGFENWADGDRRGRIMTGLQGWAREYRGAVESGTPPLEAFERLKFWVIDLEHVGHVMNEENLWNVVGEIGSLDIATTSRPEERMAFTLLRAADRLRDRHEGEAASHLYNVLEHSPAGSSSRERLSHLDADLRSGEITRFLRGLTPWTAERPEDFYGTLWTVGTMAVSGGAGAVVGRAVAARVGSALLGQVVNIGTQAALQPIVSDGLNPIADGVYGTQVAHNAVLMGGLGVGHAAAARFGGGLLTGLGVSVAGMTAFDLITDARNRDVSPGLLIANSLGNDLIGRASGGVQREAPALARWMTTSPNARNAATAAAAAVLLQACDAPTSGQVVSTLGLTGVFGSWLALSGRALINQFRSIGAARSVEPLPLALHGIESGEFPVEMTAEIAPTDVDEATQDNVVHEHPELLIPEANIDAQQPSGVLRFLFAAFNATDRDRPVRIDHYAPDDGLLVLRTPTGQRATTAQWLMGHIGGNGLEVTNGSVLAGDFRVRPMEGSGESLHVMVVEREPSATPPEGSGVRTRPQDGDFTDPDAATPTQSFESTDVEHVIEATPITGSLAATLLPGAALLLGGCDGHSTPAALAAAAGVGAIIALGRRLLSNFRALEAPRSTAPVEPAMQNQETAAMTVAGALSSMSSRWRGRLANGLGGDRFVAAHRDAEELGRMAVRVSTETDAVQAEYMQLVADLWATGNATVRGHLRPVLDNAGRTLRPNVIRSLTLRVLGSHESLRAAANLVTFLPPAERADVLERFVETSGGLAALMNLPRGVFNAQERARLADLGARVALRRDDITMPMLRTLAMGTDVGNLSPLARAVLNPRFNLDAAPTAAERRVLLLGRTDLSDVERAALQEALLPRMIR